MVDEPLFFAQSGEQLCARERVALVGETSRPLQLRRRFAVCAEAGCRTRSSRCVLQHGSRVSCRLGVVGQPGVILVARVDQQVQDRLVQLGTTMRGQGFLDRAPRDLVPEAEPIGL